MIGNDVIDLQLAATQSNWKRRGFLDKLFHPFEQEQILNSATPEFIVWLLWSMKESTYKARQRKLKLAPRFNPLSFRCEINQFRPSGATGEVKLGKTSFFTNSTFNMALIHSVSSTTMQPKIIKQIFGSSKNLKEEFITLVAKMKQLSPAEITIEKDLFSIPHLYHNTQSLKCHFSLSHHGQFSAFSWALINS